MTTGGQATNVRGKGRDNDDSKFHPQERQDYQITEQQFAKERRRQRTRVVPKTTYFLNLSASGTPGELATALYT